MKKSVAVTTVLLCCLVSPSAAQRGQEDKPQSRPSKSSGAEDAKAQDAKAKTRKRGQKRRQGGYLGLFISDSVRDGNGVVTIDSVFQGSDAEKLGFKAGDEVVSVNGRSVPNGDQFIMLLWMSGRGDGRGRRSDRGGRQRGRVGVDSQIVVRRKGKQVAIKAGMRELDAHPKVGDKAPDFKLASPDGKTEWVLSKLVGKKSVDKKPLVLIFGSYT
ncbi:MAG: PDZ domain-containing protein [Planctomycetota bacterium]|jgi:hypothetical protein